MERNSERLGAISWLPGLIADRQETDRGRDRCERSAISLLPQPIAHVELVFSVSARVAIGAIGSLLCS
jgi:hypothetical protein